MTALPVRSLPCRRILTCLMLFAVTWVADATAADATLSGIATYRERTELPANVVFEATLADVSRADAPAVTLGKVRIEAPQRLPLKFSIAYDPSRIVASHRYAVRAHIALGNQLLFISDNAVAVDFSQHEPTEVALHAGGMPVKQTGPTTKENGDAANAGAVKATAGIEDSNWRLTTLGGALVIAREQKLEPFLRLQSEDKRLVGFGGCNQLMGSYALNADKVSFAQISITRTACQRGMETEALFLTMLGKASGWRISAGRLELLDSAGATLAQFELRPAK